MHLHLLLPLLIFPLLFFGVLGSEDEVRSLLEFKKGIRDDPLGRVHNSWDRSSVGADGCPRTWYGVVCDDITVSVTALVLEDLNLSGELKFSTLTGLRMLRNLSLSGNFFSGRLVPSMGGMTSLQHLDLSRNQFYGPIPARINDLWDLNYLNLSSNNFTGGFPSGIRNLQQLKVLDLHSNRLWSDIGDLLSELGNVELVDLSFNMFSGGLSSLGANNISSLANTVQYVNMSHNKLNGEFFSVDSVKLFRNLDVLDLGDNQLTGQLPSFGSLSNLRILRLGNNLLYGSIPEELLGNSIPLEELDLSSNGFSGSIQEINSTVLKVLNLSSNVLMGSLPSTLGGCIILDLSKNMISSDISTVQNWGNSLEVIDLSSNSLSGSFPNQTSQFQRLTSIKIRNSSLSGGLPLALGTYPSLSTVDFSLNELTGHIPSSFFTSLTLTNLNLSGNRFTGSIPVQGPHTTELLFLPSYSNMESLDLSSNSLTGSLPSGIGDMGRLKLLNLAKNSLSGQIPSQLSKLNGLEYLDLSSNHFKGEIPYRLPSTLKFFNVSYNDLSGPVPGNLKHFPPTSFHPGNPLLSPNGMAAQNSGSGGFHGSGQHHSSKTSIRVAISLASVGAMVMIVFVLLAYYRGHLQEFPRRSGVSGQTMGRDIKLGRFTRPSLFNFHKNVDPPPASLSFSNDHLLNSNARSMSGFVIGTAEHGLTEGIEAGQDSIKPDLSDNHPPTSGRKSSPGSPLSSSPRFIEVCEQPGMLNVYSPDRLAGELFFLDNSLLFTAEELSRAPAEVLGRSSHGTLYKATLDNGHILTVKWLRVGLVKHKKEFAKEAKKIGSIRHPNIVPLRAYYWGPREQERLILADYIHGDSLALHLYETTPRRYSPLSFSQRLKIAVDVALCLTYLHDKGLPHGNLKPTNVLLVDRDFTARLTDYGLHRLMTPAGTAEQILNLGALGYRAPEVATAAKPLPSFKADVYAFGVILMELLTKRSAGDIISGQTGAVDLTDWVRLCAHEGRGTECFDRDIASGEEPTKAMDELLDISLRCILPVNERPNIRQVFEDLCSVSV
ncbi:probable inactive receptor kinase At5g10020 [Telopea speciosissima]|uniref:probable inactive receptor kinase At5g10020 n=1 Tax=Telopea speciosissima TaxID=54955 RepID=UPI001CC519CB|nr:probable inactive receptor kinase At5g10020 [Telopea speciosissima]